MSDESGPVGERSDLLDRYICVSDLLVKAYHSDDPDLDRYLKDAKEAGQALWMHDARLRAASAPRPRRISLSGRREPEHQDGDAYYVRRERGSPDELHTKR